jgi:PleD family two-component response regulator
MIGQSVLIIEDDKDTAVLFKTVLSLVGFECDIVLSAREALAWLAASVPDLILLDIRLGLEIGGDDILYQIRNNPRFDHTRVVVITGFPRLAEPITDLADLILLKPVDVDQLKSLVTRIIAEDRAPKLIPYQDPVTELYKEDFFYSRMELACERSKRRADFRFGIIVLEARIADRFEQDMAPDIILGLLRGVAGRLYRTLRTTDTISRLAGWKFAILYEEITQPEDAEIIIQRVIAELSKPYKISEQMMHIEVYAGAVVYHSAEDTPEKMMLAAQSSLKKAIETELDSRYLIAEVNR